MKTVDVLDLYRILISAKLPKLSDNGQIKLIKLCNSLKKIIVPLEDFEKDARERLKDELFDAMSEKVRQWQTEGENTTLSETEKKELHEYFADYNNRVNECLSEELDKSHDVTVETISDMAFEQLLSANEFDVRSAMKLSEYLLNETIS